MRYVGQKTIFANGIKNAQEPTRETFVKQEDFIKSVQPVFVKLINDYGSNPRERELEVLFACQAYWGETTSIKCKLTDMVYTVYITD
jgi:hypothetical protein